MRPQALLEHHLSRAPLHMTEVHLGYIVSRCKESESPHVPSLGVDHLPSGVLSQQITTYLLCYCEYLAIGVAWI